MRCPAAYARGPAPIARRLCTKALGTEGQGVVRFFGAMNDDADADAAIAAIKELASEVFWR